MTMIRPMVVLVSLLVSTVATAATDCADWNTGAFAEAADRARWHACLAAWADPTARDEYGTTPLHWAVSEGHASVVKALLDAEAKLGARNEYGHTPLHEAAFGGHASVVEALLAAGAKPDARDKYGGTALNWAVSGGHASVVKALLGAGAKPDARDKEGKTPFDWISSELKGTDVYWELHDGQYR